jgi:hypothetical protein
MRGIIGLIAFAAINASTIFTSAHIERWIYTA